MEMHAPKYRQYNAKEKQTDTKRERERERERESTNGINGVNISPKVKIERIRGRVGSARIDGHEALLHEVRLDNYRHTCSLVT